MKIVVYRVNKRYNLEEISDLLKKSVRPGSWVEMGGEGFVKEISIRSDDYFYLAVGQDSNIQGQIRFFFNQLRMMLSKSPEETQIFPDSTDRSGSSFKTL